MILKDYWVDGHYIVAMGPYDAREEARRLYDYEPTTVRRWNPETDVS